VIGCGTLAFMSMAPYEPAAIRSSGSKLRSKPEGCLPEIRHCLKTGIAGNQALPENRQLRVSGISRVP
jgi:hypothetical protein